MRFLALALLPTCALSCLIGYDIFFDGQCLRYKGFDTFTNARSICAEEKENDHMLILHSQQEQDEFHAADSFPEDVWLDLNCDGQKFVWGDGSEATYTNFKDIRTCNKSLTDVRYYISGKDKFWYPANGPKELRDYFCHAAIRSWVCDSYDHVQLSTGAEVCYWMNEGSLNWAEAESRCKSKDAHIATIHDQSMNDFLKRSATAYSMMAGVHIGLKHQDDGQYVWSDGSEKNFDNFAPGYPNTHNGECVSMEIGSAYPGKWTNENCAFMLPYMCTKPAGVYDESVKPAGCPQKTQYGPGDEIFSPTWGQATGPASCDYTLTTDDPKKMITVEIVFFESNKCCDTLTIYDGTTVLKSFSGYVGITSLKLMGSSNSIRMEWRATSGAHVRGWHAIVGAA